MWTCDEALCITHDAYAKSIFDRKRKKKGERSKWRKKWSRNTPTLQFYHSLFYHLQSTIHSSIITCPLSLCHLSLLPSQHSMIYDRLQIDISKVTSLIHSHNRIKWHVKNASVEFYLGSTAHPTKRIPSVQTIKQILKWTKSLGSIEMKKTFSTHLALSWGR